MGELEDMKVDLAEQRRRFPGSAGVPALDQSKQWRPAGLEQLRILKIWVAARDEVVG
ncbi:MAG: hypothetical protein K0S88_6152, partial [Actinomycetia bacterium]|nr:hypothetical protein [Actinomycetes bacterium]